MSIPIAIEARDPSRQFDRLPSVDGYAMSFVKLGSRFQVERLRRERGELVGELTVVCNLPGRKSTSDRLHVADLNFSSARARTERSKIIAERANVPEVDWTGLLEEFVQQVLEAERVGTPAVMLRDLARPAVDDELVVDAGIRLPRRHAAIIFGDGGDAKSYLGLYWATRLCDAGLRVLYADWEFAGEDHRDRLERITGPEMPDILYARCERPLTAEVDRLCRIVRDERVDYLVADSVAFAADGPPEAAEVAAGYFRALRRIGVGSLNVAHITKGENGEGKPFGSTFWHNGARSTWFVKRATGGSDPARINVALFNRKANLGPLSPAVGYMVEFEPDRTTFSRIDVADTELADKLPVIQRMQALLGREGAMTMAAIAVELDVQVDTIVKTTKRHEGKRLVRLPGADGVYRIGLLSERVAS